MQGDADTSKQVEHTSVQAPLLSDARELRRQVDEVVNSTPVIDMHTHLYPPRFGSLSLYGIDELLNYHYLVAELFRSADVTPEQFWELSKTGRADLIWETLFVRRTPLSEATRGVTAVLTALGLDQLIYKWGHSRRVISDALCEAYDALLKDGRAVTREEIERDAQRLFEGNFSRWVGL